MEVFPHKIDCKENVTKKALLCLLEIEKREGAFRVYSGYVTAKRGLHYDKLPVSLRLSMGLDYPFGWFR